MSGRRQNQHAPARANSQALCPTRLHPQQMYPSKQCARRRIAPPKHLPPLLKRARNIPFDLRRLEHAMAGVFDRSATLQEKKARQTKKRSEGPPERPKSFGRAGIAAEKQHKGRHTRAVRQQSSREAHEE